jgi:hypothetical protein
MIECYNMDTLMLNFDTPSFSRLFGESLKDTIKSITYKYVVTE